eukprot:363960-Chlamydomonas_euryale.AAC.4
MACFEESDREGSSRKRKLPATGFARPYAARGAQLRPMSRAATLTAINVAIRGGRMTERLCLRSVGRQQRHPAGWASQPACGPHNRRHIAGLCFRCQEAHVWNHLGVCFNSRSTARRWQGTEPVFPQD